MLNAKEADTKNVPIAHLPHFYSEENVKVPALKEKKKMKLVRNVLVNAIQIVKLVMEINLMNAMFQLSVYIFTLSAIIQENS